MTGYGMKLTTLVSLNAPNAHKTPPQSKKINDEAATHVATKSRRVSAGTAAYDRAPSSSKDHTSNVCFFVGAMFFQHWSASCARSGAKPTSVDAMHHGTWLRKAKTTPVKAVPSNAPSTPTKTNRGSSLPKMACAVDAYITQVTTKATQVAMTSVRNCG